MVLLYSETTIISPKIHVSMFEQHAMALTLKHIYGELNSNVLKTFISQNGYISALYHHQPSI